MVWVVTPVALPTNLGASAADASGLLKEGLSCMETLGQLLKNRVQG